MNTQLSSYWEPIEPVSDFPPVYFDGDDKDHIDKNDRGEIIVDPKLRYCLMGSLLFVFVLASGFFFATMSFAILEVETTIDTLQLPLKHQVLSDLQRIENAATLLFIAVYLGLAVLAIWGGHYLPRKKAGTQPNFSAAGI